MVPHVPVNAIEEERDPADPPSEAKRPSVPGNRPGHCRRASWVGRRSRMLESCGARTMRWSTPRPTDRFNSPSARTTMWRQMTTPWAIAARLGRPGPNTRRRRRSPGGRHRRESPGRLTARDSPSARRPLISSGHPFRIPDRQGGQRDEASRRVRRPTRRYCCQSLCAEITTFVRVFVDGRTTPATCR